VDLIPLLNGQGMEHTHKQQPDVQLIENFLPNDVVEEFKELHQSPNFPWYLNKATTNIENYRDDENIKETYQFCHTAVNNTKINSDFFEQMKIIAFYLESAINKRIKQFIRVKSNLLCPQPNFCEDNFQPPHLDYPKDLNKNDIFSFLYFVNNSDGDVRFFDNDFNIIKKVTPKKGTGVFFKSNIWHSGSNPIQTTERINTNYIFSIKEDS